MLQTHLCEFVVMMDSLIKKEDILGSDLIYLLKGWGDSYYSHIRYGDHMNDKVRVIIKADGFFLYACEDTLKKNLLLVTDNIKEVKQYIIKLSKESA